MKKVLLILFVLIIILFALSFFQKSKVTDEEGIDITYKDKETFLSYTQIRSNEQIRFTTNRGDKFNGYDLSSILNSIDIPINIETEFIFHSKDGGILNLTKLEKESFYLVFQEDATGQFIRLVVPTDEFSQRWIKYLVAIEIE